MSFALISRSWINALTLSQEKLILKDFNIENETNVVAETPLALPIHNISVTNNILEIRFYWAGKGTTRIPDVGVYGPLVSALSVVSGECILLYLNTKGCMVTVYGIKHTSFLSSIYYCC